jgi:outer membrane protein OmpU
MENYSGTDGGKSLSMGNQLTFTGGGEMDNGMNVSLSFVIDQADGVTAATAPFDGHSISVGSDAMGTITFAGEGASSAQNTVDTTAAGDIWDHTAWGYTNPSNADAQNTLRWTMPSMVDGLAADVSYAGSAAGIEATIGYALTYTGVEGLSLTYAKGERGATATKGDIETLKASFAFGPVTAAMSINDYKNDSTANEEQTSYMVTYAVTDELSASFGSETVETVGGTDEEFDRIKVAYTTGGLTLSASKSNADNVVGGSSTEQSHWDLGLSFAF